MPQSALRDFRNWLGALRHRAPKFIRLACERRGYTVTQRGDYYSPTPSEIALEEHAARWTKPSALRGIAYDLPAMKTELAGLINDFFAEFAALPPYQSLLTSDFGPGYNQVDAFTLYAMIRRLKPKRYIEVGSGLSTYYCHLARTENARSGSSTRIRCVEPFPYRQLHEIEGIEVIESEVQDVSVATFAALENGDVLFIDSSHVVRIDGDVPYLFLEVLPSLAPGVWIHIHDVPFPFNVPFPPGYWTLLNHRQSRQWPVFWNEAMLVQAFLAFNSAFEIVLSCPMIRHFDEGYLKDRLPIYKSLEEEPNTFSSLWLRRKVLR